MLTGKDYILVLQELMQLIEEYLPAKLANEITSKEAVLLGVKTAIDAIIKADKREKE